MAFEHGIKSYIRGVSTVEVLFPVDWNGREYICCKYCPYLSGNERICQLNKEPVFQSEKYVGPSCPLTPGEEVR